MSVIAHQMPLPAARPSLRLVPPYQGPVQGVARKPAQSTYWARRLAVAAVSVMILAGAWSIVRAGVGVLDSSASASSSIKLASASTPVSSETWTVRPGDTLWSIARSVKPSGDIRPVLDPLIKRYSDQPLQVGQTIVVSVNGK
jgi:LysM repeat protein